MWGSCGDHVRVSYDCDRDVGAAEKRREELYSRDLLLKDQLDHAQPRKVEGP